MWKPGEAKPSSSAAAVSAATNMNNTTPPLPTSHRDGVVAPKETPPSRGASKKLSGATLNMRFMQRGNRNNNSNRRHSSDGRMQQGGSGRNSSSSHRPMDNTEHAQSQDDVSQSQHAAAETSSLSIDDEEPMVATASATDMYGSQANLLGRRSFGGFNRHMASAWHDCRLAHKSSSNSSAGVSDQELLRRYANADSSSGKRRQNHQGSSPSSRPIGNLNDKLKKRRRKAKSLS